MSDQLRLMLEDYITYHEHKREMAIDMSPYGIQTITEDRVFSDIKEMLSESLKP